MNKDISFPQIIRKNDSLTIRLKAANSHESIVKEDNIILDLNHFDDVIGLEILSPRYKYKIKDIKEFEDQKTGLKLLFDSEADALYIYILKESSNKQEVKNGNIYLSSEGELSGIEVFI